MRIVKCLNQNIRLMIICAILSGTVLMSASKTERIGDNLQIALPALALACSFANGQALEYTIRFIVMESVLHGLKNGFGKAELNARPSGGYRGFPSGHTTAAFFGASSLVNDCIKSNRYVKAAVMLSAAFVGGSRIEADKHTTLQVIAGSLLGWVAQRAPFNQGRMTRLLRLTFIRMLRLFGRLRQN